MAVFSAEMREEVRKAHGDAVVRQLDRLSKVERWLAEKIGDVMEEACKKGLAEIGADAWQPERAVLAMISEAMSESYAIAATNFYAASENKLGPMEFVQMCKRSVIGNLLNEARERAEEQETPTDNVEDIIRAAAARGAGK